MNELRFDMAATSCVEKVLTLRQVVQIGLSNDVALVLDALNTISTTGRSTDLYHVCVERASEDDLVIINQLFEANLRPPSLQKNTRDGQDMP